MSLSINYENLIKKINKVLCMNYPIKFNNLKNLDKLKNLSHFFLKINHINKFLPFEININGKILSGKYNNYQIIKVITNKEYLWNDFILLYVSIFDNYYNPCVNENNFINLLHNYNFINVLNIKKIIATKNNKTVNISVNYISKKPYKLIFKNNKILNKINKNNYFYFNSFNLNKDTEITEKLNRLIKNRDKFDSIHFFLDNNGGGALIPVHLIIRCLVGKKEKWMKKSITKILTNGNTYKWDCWKEENKIGNNSVKKLQLDTLPNYKTKYKGKIYLHMTKDNGSAAWFFITYLIYAFGGNIKRYTKNCFGQKIKFGTINNKNSQLILKGHSDTTSGDGNNIYIKYKNITIGCPTEQFISSSIKKNDWNRYWIE
jgi:hypothetical protein